MFRDTRIVFRRQLRMTLRSPVMIIVGLLQPVLYLALFAPLLSSISPQLNSSNHLTFFVPGLLVQLAVFGAAFSGYGIIGEWRDGVIEAERVTSAHRSALLIGRVCRDVLQLLVQVLILVALGYALGMDAPFGQALVGVVITLVLGAACSAASNALGLSMKNERSMGGIINMILLPVILLSGILLPMQLGPEWLQNISNLIPVRHVVDAVRACFSGDLSIASVFWGGTWAVVLAALGTWWGTATVRRNA